MDLREKAENEPMDFSVVLTDIHGNRAVSTLCDSTILYLAFPVLMLGDIVVSVEKVVEQAEKYGHSQERELAFLVAHSMMHLFGYDHMEPDEAAVMESKQREILDNLGITR